MDWHYHPLLSPESELNYIQHQFCSGRFWSVDQANSTLHPVLPVPV